MRVGVSVRVRVRVSVRVRVRVSVRVRVRVSHLGDDALHAAVQHGLKLLDDPLGLHLVRVSGQCQGWGWGLGLGLGLGLGRG